MRKKISLLCISFTLLLSCEDYLSESPDNRLELNTIEKVANLGARAYAQGSYIFTDELTDLAGPMGRRNSRGEAIDTGGNTITISNEQAYTFQDITDDNVDSPTNYWNSAYNAIAHANQVLKSLPEITGDIKHKEALTGEALLVRAYYHFMLANLFGKYYDINTASNDLGVPYIIEPETTLLPTYQRETIQRVYDLVERDMTEGIALINEDFFSGTKKFRFSKRVGLAFATRFYLWKGEFEKVIEMADAFYNERDPIDFITDFSTIGGTGYDETVDTYNKPEDDSNLLFAQVFTIHQRRSFGYRLNSNELNSLLSSPIGNYQYGNEDTGGIWEADTQARYLARIREFFFRENLSSNAGAPYIIEQLFKGEEVILNRAEAKLRKANPDFEGALADLNIIVAAHYEGQMYTEDIINSLALQNSINPEEELLNTIIEERKVEFLDHGLRWFDIKRFKIPVTHELPLDKGGGIVTLSAEDPRKVFQIPPDAIANGLIPNPR